MAIQKKYDQMDLGGGHHDGLPAELIADNEAAEAINWYPFGRLIRRHGFLPLSTEQHSELLNGVTAYRDRDGNFTIIVGGRTGLAKLDGTTFVSLTGAAVTSSELPWDFHQYKSIGYALREDAGLRRFDANSFDAAGIAAPTAAPTIAASGAGAVEAGDYYGVYTYYNTISGVESNPSPKSSVVTAGGATGLAWSAIGVSPTGQVNARRLYRTLPDQLGEYFFVATLLDNSATTYADAILLDDLGSPVSFDNGVPPSDLLFGDFWKDRLFASDGKDVFFGEFGLAECFAADSIINVLREDGAEVRAIRGWGSRLAVGKTNAVYFLTTTGPRTFDRDVLADRYGCYSHHSMKVIEGTLLWYTGDNFARSDGTKPTLIATSKIRRILDAIPDAYKNRVTAEVYSRYGLYLVNVPQTGSEVAGQNQLTLCYNIKSDAWTVWNYQDGQAYAPSHIARIHGDDFEEQLFTTFYDKHVYDFLNENAKKDNFEEGQATAIVASWKSKFWSFDYPGLMKALKQVLFLANNVGGTLTLSVYRNGEDTAYKTRTVSFDTGQPWKVFNLSTIKDPSTTIQLGIEYGGEDALELQAVSMEILHLARTTRAA